MPKLRNKVFLDANVIIAATLSISGGSFLLITQASKNSFQLFSCQYALDEVIENLKEKYPDYLSVLKSLLLFSNLQILKNPSQKEIEKATKLIDFKDAPILASALKHISLIQFTIKINF